MRTSGKTGGGGFPLRFGWHGGAGGKRMLLPFYVYFMPGVFGM